MEQSYRTPGWLSGLLVLFSIATATTFGLFLYKHAEEAAVYERYVHLKTERNVLGAEKVEVEKQIPIADKAIAARDTMIDTLKKDHEQTQQDTERLLGDLDQAQKSSAEAQAKEVKTYHTLLEDAHHRRVELGQQEATALAAERDFDDRRRKQRDSIEKTATEVEAIRRDTRDQDAKLQARIDELAQRVGQLTQQRDVNARELKSDGEILAARAADGYVVVNRGHQQHLRKGTRFVVYNRRGGKNVVKGAVEIVDVDASTSTARVDQELDGNDPLVPGDQIANPVYDADAVRTFVIKGDFHRFSKDELARFIVDAGAKVSEDLTTSVDYLVAGDRADKALEQATKLGISILSEDQLLDFVRYKPDYAVRSGMVVVLKGKFTVVSKGKIEDFVSQSGGTIGSDVRSGVQVLIAGQGADNDIAKARTLGITVIDQSQFAHLADDKKKK